MNDLEDETLLGDDVIQKPSTDQANKTPITVIPEDDLHKMPLQGAPQELIERLPNMDVSFKLVEEGHSKVVNMKEVEEEIVSQEAISKDKAQYVNVAFESLFQGPVNLNEFTKTPSKTNYSYVLKHMKQAIAVEEASVVANFQLMIDNPLNDYKATLNQIKLGCIPSLVETLYTLRGLTTSGKDPSSSISLMADMEQSKSSMVEYDDGFTNLTTIDLLSIEPFKFKGLPGDPENIESYFSTLRLLFGYGYFNGFFHSAINSTPFDNNSASFYHGASVILRDLVKFFSCDIYSKLEVVKGQADVAINYMEEIQEASEKHKGNKEAMVSYISNNLPKMQSCFRDVDNIVHLVNDLGKLAWVTTSLISLYKKL